MPAPQRCLRSATPASKRSARGSDARAAAPAHGSSTNYVSGVDGSGVGVGVGSGFGVGVSGSGVTGSVA